MACIQACGSAEAYHAKHKTVVEELRKMAQIVLNKHGNEHRVMTAGFIANNAKENCMKFLNAHDWKGETLIPYPKYIANCQTGNFLRSGSAHGGKFSDEAAVVYDDGCGFGVLLAWSVVEHLECVNLNKVYVETGPIVTYYCISWDLIKDKLEASSHTSYNKTAGHEVYAEIGSGSKATLVATYNSY